MNKIILQFIILLFAHMVLFSQQTNTIKSFQNSLKASISLEQGSLTLDKASSSVNEKDRIALKNAMLKDGDLLINFEVAKFRSPEKKLNLKVLPYITSMSGEKLVAQPKSIEGNFNNKYNTKPQQLQLIWNDFQDQYRLAEESVTLHLQGDLIGVTPIDCNNPPIFGKQQKLLHYIIGGLSIGSVITGYALENSSDDLYLQYRGEVFEGASNAIATSTYNKANNRNKAAGLLKTAGYSVFAANAAVYIFRQIRYNQKKKDYDYYCEQKKWNVQPFLNVESENAYAGMLVALKF